MKSGFSVEVEVRLRDRESFHKAIQMDLSDQILSLIDGRGASEVNFLTDRPAYISIRMMKPNKKKRKA